MLPSPSITQRAHEVEHRAHETAEELRELVQALGQGEATSKQEAAAWEALARHLTDEASAVSTAAVAVQQRVEQLDAVVAELAATNALLTRCLIELLTPEQRQRILDQKD
jgi:hypothetical protein